MCIAITGIKLGVVVMQFDIQCFVMQFDIQCFVMQFVPQYSTYTCYQDVEDEQASPAPSGQYRHATYVIRDPFQEQAIAQSRAQSQVCLVHAPVAFKYGE
jgi:hypothetical protein